MPAWIGTAIGAIFCVFFLIVGDVSNWSEVSSLVSVRSESLEGSSVSLVDLRDVPYLFPMFGFLLGFMVVLYRKNRE